MHEVGTQRIQDRMTQHAVCLANRTLIDSTFHVALSETLHSSLTTACLDRNNGTHVKVSW